MNAAETGQYITDTFKGVDVVTANGDSFFFYYPDRSLPADYRFPFVTLVNSDVNDQFSDLNRPNVFRLNIGVSKQTFRSLFGLPERPSDTDDDETAESDDNTASYDFTAFDQVMPHPVYGRQYWVCILNPSKETFATKVHPLLAEAYEMAVSKYDKQASRK